MSRFDHLDPEYRVLMEAMPAVLTIDLSSMSAMEAAASLRQAMAPTALPPDATLRWEDRMIPSAGGPLPVRIYRPANGFGQGIMVNAHGGGWVTGSVASDHARCCALARASGCNIVAVEYRLAPEHPFPTAVDDVYAALRWTAEQASALGFDPGRIAIGGTSAGGNIAAACTLMARARGGPDILFQHLLSPVTNADFGTASYRAYGDGHALDTGMMRWMWDQYVPARGDRANPLASPLLEPDLRGLPPAFIQTAELDPLRDEGEAYGERLRAAGVPTRHIRYDGVMHGFVTLGLEFGKARTAIADAARYMAGALRAPVPTS
jgi:acetyl esterase